MMTLEVFLNPDHCSRVICKFYRVADDLFMKVLMIIFSKARMAGVFVKDVFV